MDRFFFVFGISFVAGGIGHAWFNYFGIAGKSIAWFTSIYAVYFLEQAMISLYFKADKIALFKGVSKIKLWVTWLSLGAVLVFIDLKNDPQIGILIPSISTAVGFVLCLGILGKIYAKRIAKTFTYTWISVIVLIPSAIVQGLKISFYPLMDRNDISHILLLIMLILYWKSIVGYHLKLIKHPNY